MARTSNRKLTLSRRTVVTGSIALLAVPSIAVQRACAELIGGQSASFQEAYAKILGNRTPETGAFAIDLPEQAENGNMVLFKLNAESPMTEAEHVKAFHLLSTQNPHGHVATFRLTLLSGKASVTGRMRLAKTQDVIALAELSDGRILQASRKVAVTIGGCGI